MTFIEIDFTKPAPQRAFELGDYVLYRDADKFLVGAPDHTVVARVVFERFATLKERVTILATGESVLVDRRFLRLIPAVDIMRDVDVAPLAMDYPGLHPAAVAWLQQNSRPAEARPELESGGEQR